VPRLSFRLGGVFTGHAIDFRWQNLNTCQQRYNRAMADHVIRISEADAPATSRRCWLGYARVRKL
jgi:hypothetical protein